MCRQLESNLNVWFLRCANGETDRRAKNRQTDTLTTVSRTITGGKVTNGKCRVASKQAGSGKLPA